jgi:hypothetical protein
LTNSGCVFGGVSGVLITGVVVECCLIEEFGALTRVVI